MGITTDGWDSTNKGYKFTNNDQTLFLPAAGYVNGTSFTGVDSKGYYWSGRANSATSANTLYFSSTYNAYAQGTSNLYSGLSVRPVRLVAVD